MKAQECRLNLCFQLNVPKALAGKVGVSQDVAMTGESLQEMMEQVFDSEEERIFQRIAKQNYAPMLEILESKLRRHANFRATVIVDPCWLTLAKKYNEVLVNRLRGVILTGRVDLVYGLSIAKPVGKDKAEVLMLAKQVRQNQENFWQVLGTKCRVVGLNDLAYDVDLAGLLEKMGFEAYLIKGDQKLNEWAGPNETYLPVSCDKMLVIIENNSLARLLLQRSKFEMVDGEIMLVDDFYRKVVAECWKGGVVTLILDAEEMQIDADTQDGIATFIRDLVEKWFESNTNVFTSVAKICELSLPFAELELVNEADNFDANKVMERARQISMAKKAQDELKEKKQPAQDKENSVVERDDDVLVVKMARKKAAKMLSPVAEDAELVNVNFARSKKQPAHKVATNSEDEVKVVIGASKVKEKPVLSKASKPIATEERVLVKREVKKKPKLEMSKTPRPVKAPGYVLQTKMIDKAQLESRLHDEDVIDVKRSNDASGGDRVMLDFDELWTFDNEVPSEEMLTVGKQKIPSIGSGNGRFGGIQEENIGHGEIEQFNYDLVEPQKKVRQIRFTAISEGDFGEIREFNRTK